MLLYLMLHELCLMYDLLRNLKFCHPIFVNHMTPQISRTFRYMYVNGCVYEESTFSSHVQSCVYADWAIGVVLLKVFGL